MLTLGTTAAGVAAVANPTGTAVVAVPSALTFAGGPFYHKSNYSKLLCI